MDAEALAFLLFAAVAAATPGPSNVLVMAAGARSGFTGGLRCLAGVVTGMAALMGLAVLGLGEVLRALPSALLALKAIGSVVLLRMAWQIATAPPANNDTAPGASAVGFGQAFLFQWVNPKSWVVSASAAATFGAASGQSPAVRALWLAALFALAAAPGCGAWLVSGALLQRWLRDAATARRFQRAMGVLLAASVAMLWT